MKAPTPPEFANFNLNAEQYAEFKRRVQLVRSKFIAIERLATWSMAIVGGAIGGVSPILFKWNSKGFLVPTLAILAGVLFFNFAEKLICHLENRKLAKFHDSFMFERISAYHAAVEAYKVKLEEFRRSRREFWTSLSGQDFEQELANLYRRLGYEATVARAGGDGGIDIDLFGNGEHVIVQCKAHGKPVGPHVVRDLFGTLTQSGASRAILASTSGFTSGVKNFIIGKKIELLAVDDIIQLQESITN